MKFVFLLFVFVAHVSASTLRKGYVVALAPSVSEYIKEGLEEDIFERRNMCGNDLIRTLETTCKNGASLEKHDFSPEELNNIWTGCCYPGCSIAEVHLAFCK
uniref:IlGF domain-containing protein n=1 Tax=Steinernema glaseri TaxID=37863 RepID=A0A1I7Y3M7_9BILA